MLDRSVALTKNFELTTDLSESLSLKTYKRLESWQERIHIAFRMIKASLFIGLE
jgi:hypothetical protein